MGANLALALGYVRSFQGTRAYSQQPFYPGQNLTLIGAIALKGFLGGMTLEGGTNGVAFQVFLDKVLLPQLWPGACVVMDNLPAHKVKGVREKIEAYLHSVAARSREFLFVNSRMDRKAHFIRDNYSLRPCI